MTARQTERIKRLIGRQVRVTLKDSTTDVTGVITLASDNRIELLVTVPLRNIVQVAFEETISTARRPQ